MEAIEITRLDHFGLILGVIKDLGIIEMINDSVDLTFFKKIS